MDGKELGQYTKTNGLNISSFATDSIPAPALHIVTALTEDKEVEDYQKGGKAFLVSSQRNSRI
jgi:hypothetical protein